MPFFQSAGVTEPNEQFLSPAPSVKRKARERNNFASSSRFGRSEKVGAIASKMAVMQAPFLPVRLCSADFI